MLPNIVVRTLSGAVYVALIVAAILVPGYTFFGIVFGLCMALCLWELRTITHPKSHGTQRQYWWYIPMQLYIIVAFLSLCLLIGMPESVLPHNRELTLLLFVSLWVNDTFAYLTGYSLSFVKSYKKHPMAPSISPNKSIEGLVGGLVMTAVLAWVATYFIDADLKPLLLYCEIVAVAGTFGDLLESKIKRITGVKDSSNLIPGHGGFLDRLDSALLAAPCALAFLLAGM